MRHTILQTVLASTSVASSDPGWKDTWGPGATTVPAVLPLQFVAHKAHNAAVNAWDAA
jgi:hypothetical protein